MNEINPYIFELMKEVKIIRTSDGFAFLQKIYRFRIAYAVYSENRRVLLRTLKKYYVNPIILSKNTVKRWRKQRIINKDIHNVVSSSKAYIDHVSKMNQDFQVVQDKIQIEIKDQSIYHFIRAFRNFILHEEPFSLVSKAVWSKEKPDELLRYESIDKTSFKNYLKDRTKDGKNTHDEIALMYLDELQDKIDINNILTEFDKMICSFHRWFILTYVNEKFSDLQSLYQAVDVLHHEAAINGFNQEHPITKSQLRHLKLLIKKSKEIYG